MAGTGIEPADSGASVIARVEMSSATGRGTLCVEAEPSGRPSVGEDDGTRMSMAVEPGLQRSTLARIVRRWRDAGYRLCSIRGDTASR